MAILWKGCKPDNFEPHNSVKLSFTNIWGLHSNCVECESFHESNSPDILPLCETNLDESIEADNFSGMGYLPLTQKDSIAWSCSLFKERASLSTEVISRKICRFLCIWLALLHSRT